MRVTERLSHDYPKSEIAGNGSSDNKKVMKSGRTEYVWYFCINKVLYQKKQEGGEYVEVRGKEERVRSNKNAPSLVCE